MALDPQEQRARAKAKADLEKWAKDPKRTKLSREICKLGLARLENRTYKMDLPEPQEDREAKRRERERKRDRARLIEKERKVREGPPRPPRSTIEKTGPLGPPEPRSPATQPAGQPESQQGPNQDLDAMFDQAIADAEKDLAQPSLLNPDPTDGWQPPETPEDSDIPF